MPRYNVDGPNKSGHDGGEGVGLGLFACIVR